MFNKLSLVALAAVFSTAHGLTWMSDKLMNDYLNAGGAHLAWFYSPVFFFGAGGDNTPCIPTWTFNKGTETDHDTYLPEYKTPAADLCAWPNAGCDCRHPGVKKGNPTAPFPVYYTYTHCGDNEVRVAYNLFYQKDGFWPAGTVGHKYDWERVIVIIKKHPENDNRWWPYSIALSDHRGYKRMLWQDIQNTLTHEQATSSDPRTPNGVTWEDHPKVYVAWAKHNMFEDRYTAVYDDLAQLSDNAYRSQDWWYFVDEKYYIRADDSTEAGKVIKDADWGEATSTPASVHYGICDI